MLQIVDFETFKILLIFLEDNLDFLVISFSLWINFSFLLSTNSLIKLQSSSYRISLRNSFQISCLSCVFLTLPTLLLFYAVPQKIEINEFISLLLYKNYLYFLFKSSFCWISNCLVFCISIHRFLQLFDSYRFHSLIHSFGFNCFLT